MNPLQLLLSALGADAATLAEIQPLGSAILHTYEAVALTNPGAGLNLRFYRALGSQFPNLAQSALNAAYRYVAYLQDPGIILSQLPPTTHLPELMARAVEPPDRGLATGINARYIVQVTIHDPESGQTAVAYRTIYGYAGESFASLFAEAEAGVLESGGYEGELWPLGADVDNLELSSEMFDAATFI